MSVQLSVRGHDEQVGSQVPLVGWIADAKVIDFVCEVRLQQCFKNTLSCAGEAIYSFPLDNESSICSFKAEFDSGEVINGVLKERDQAIQEYDIAKKNGLKAGILECDRPDIFHVSIGNIAADEHVRISLTYVSVIRSESEEEACFVFPTSLAPLYSSPYASPVSECEIQHSVRLQGHALHVCFQCTSPIVSLSCPSHASESGLVITTNGNTGNISLTDVTVGKDVVMLCQEASPHEPHAVLEVRQDGSAAGLVSLFPCVAPSDLPHEFYFVVDRSGSMCGPRIEDAAAALKLFLRGLPPGSFFDVVGFGSDFAALFGAPRAYDDASLDAATRYAESLRADMGGTEMIRPLQHILGRRPPPGRARSVFVLTDGCVADARGVFATVQAAADGDPAGACRVFALGIGDQVSRHLVEGIARAGRGTARFVHSGAEITAQVLAQLKAALTPALTDIAISWNYPGAPAAAQPQHVPSRAPAVLDRTRFLSFALFSPSPAGGVGVFAVSVTVAAQSPAGPMRMTAPVVRAGTGAAVAGGAVRRLAVRAAIREFEEGRGGPPCATAEEALALALGAELVTARTAYVAVELRTGEAVGRTGTSKARVLRVWGPS